MSITPTSPKTTGLQPEAADPERPAGCTLPGLSRWGADWYVTPLQGRGVYRDGLRRAGYPTDRLSGSGRPLVDLHDLGEESLHAGACRLSTPVRGDPLRLAGRREPPLVRG